MTKKAKVVKLISNSQPVELVAIIDRSGSMASIRNDSIGALNTFIEEQQKLPGEANLTVVLFDDKYEILQDRVAIKDAVKFDTTNFVPRGNTAMNDAIGRTVSSFQSLATANKIGKNVIMCVLTDGEENASKEYTNSKLKEMLTECQDKLKWEFVFLAANQDAVMNGASRGFSNANSRSYAATGAGIHKASGLLGAAVTTYRSKVDSN